MSRDDVKMTKKISREPTLPKVPPKVEHRQENLKCILTEQGIAALGTQQATALSEKE